MNIRKEKDKIRGLKVTTFVDFFNHFYVIKNYIQSYKIKNNYRFKTI